MSSDLVTRELSESDYDAWGKFVAGQPSGSIYSLPEYLSILCQISGARFRVIGVTRGSDLLGGIALYEARTRGGKVASNRLLLYYHSPVIREYGTTYPSERTSRHLHILTALVEELARQNYDHLLLHVRHAIADVRPFLSRGWRVKPNYSYVVSISDLPATFKRIDQNLRRLIHRAQDAGFEFTCDDDFDSFYRLHRATHERKGAPLYLPEAGFRKYFELLRQKDLCRLYHVRNDKGVSVATQLVLTGPHPVSHTVCAGIDPASASSGCNPMLRWKAFEALSQLGYQGNDLTDAALNDVTRFKSQLGGNLVTNWVVSAPDSTRFKMYERMAAVLNRARRIVGR
jgi:hypothetical protein